MKLLYILDKIYELIIPEYYYQNKKRFYKISLYVRLHLNSTLYNIIFKF